MIRRPNSRNRIVAYQGKRMTLMDACREMNLNYATVYSRLRYGWTIPEALEIETHPRIGGGWPKGQKRTASNRERCRQGQRERRMREQAEKMREQDAAYEEFLTQIPSIRTEPILLTRQFHHRETEDELA